MWLKIKYVVDEQDCNFFKPDTIFISIVDSITAPIDINETSVRISKIFPLIENILPPILQNQIIYLFDYRNPYQTLGTIYQRAPEDLKEKIYFSYGACSILLIADSEETIKKFDQYCKYQYDSRETWILVDGLIKGIQYDIKPFTTFNLSMIKDYSCLSTVLRSIVDESITSIQVFKNKIKHDKHNVTAVNKLFNTISVLVEELIYLNTFKGYIPQSLDVQDIGRLKNTFENQMLQQQAIDRLIQINSSLSYVSTQTYSGSIPVLERRSLVRRSSLLGIGNCVRALNRIVDYIENAFTSSNYSDIITEDMQRTPPLKVLNSNYLNSHYYDKRDWHKSNIDTFKSPNKEEDNLKKLAYFSSRRAYRESEFAITASLNSVSSGLSLEWTLMTITHEMLHSHVRIIFDSIFYTDSSDGNYKDSYSKFYEKFSQKIKNQNNENPPEYYLIDSIREAIFLYCIRTSRDGSISNQKLYESKTTPLYLPKEEDFYKIFRDEIRNLNEIFVHVLDLHYFYGGRISKYILLIWCSWAAVPQINDDIRQYILRSLIAIASKIDQDPYTRFNLAKKEFIDILMNNKSIIKNIPLISKVLEILQNEELLDEYYFNAFKNSLIIVDLIMSIFYSKKIASTLWNDENIIREQTDFETEDEFSYDAPFEEFVDMTINCPIPYLFDRMIKVLKNDIKSENIEKQTAISFLAINSQ
ncbi:MAG: hypothetical protein LBG80_15400 [Bacteroidales bacterium]|jgi:hypothetical protein|nr:hypothetical protein [Bacteroidales bacterium]